MSIPTNSNKILVVGPSKSTFEKIRKVLAKGGFDNVILETSGEAALMRCLPVQGSDEIEHGKEPFDLLLIDVANLDVDGLELCARFRMNAATRDVPILIQTDPDDLGSLDQAYMAGVDDFVINPVHEVRLYARVRTLLRMRREQKRKEMREAHLRLQNLNLKQGKIEAALIDPIVGLARDGVVELALNNCRQEGYPAALALIQINDFDLYSELHGEREAKKLKKRVAKLISTAPGPLATLLCVYGPGTFMIVQPGAESCDDIAAVADQISEMVAAAKIDHGNSTASAHVTIHKSCNWGEGDKLTSLTDELLKGARTQLLEWKYEV